MQHPIPRRRRSLTEMPDSLSVIGGGPADQPQPMHYFDSRGVKRLYLTTLTATYGTSGERLGRTGRKDLMARLRPALYRQVLG
jgi:hypothetical protein